MGYKSHGTPQRIAKGIQAERVEPNFIYHEQNNEKRQNICKYSKRTNGVIRITKAARHYHGDKF